MPSVRDEISKTFTRIAGLTEAESKREPISPEPDFAESPNFGVYQVVHRLGGGGMGRVYLATDTRLGRRVALKFLAPDLIADKTNLLRLVQEARAASSLNHPNILTIYDVGEYDGQHFIASEYVEGITLRSALERELINPHSAVEIACQIASALSAAHAAGVIHRDLKPTNIMLRPDGYVKIIDFGLAKRVVSDTQETQMMQPEGLTRPGTTLGTASYMSPEQARAEPVDFRTDIWSLGVILYEMLAGHRPFEGQTQSHVIVAIQDKPLPPLPDRAVSTGLRAVITRALAKNPGDRFSSAGEMLQQLQATVESPHPSKVGIRVTPPRPGRRAWFVAVAALLVLAIAGLFAWRYLQQPRWFHLEPVRQLTFNGQTLLATLSPNGKYLAYVVGQAEGQQKLLLRQVDSPDDETKIPARSIAYRGLTFSPDSQTLYEVEKDDTDVGRVYKIPVIGHKPAQATLDHVDGPISFSPSGDKFTYVDLGTAKKRLMYADRDGQNKRALLSLAGITMLLRPAWSPDGKRIAVMLFKEQKQEAGQAILDVVKLDGAETRIVMPGWERVGHLRWTPDGKSILTDVGTHADPNTQQIHQVAVPSGTDRPLTNDTASYKYVSLSDDGREITAVKTDTKTSIWISTSGDWTHGQTWSGGQAEHYYPSLAWVDATRLVVDSRRSGTGSPNFDLLDLQSQTPFSALTNEKQAEQSAAIIPGTNGKSIVLSSNRSGEFHIWRFDSDANRWQQLTQGNSYDVAPSVSPDGKWVVYAAQQQGTPSLMKVPVNGGPSVQVKDYAASPQISSDGKSIACFLYDTASKGWHVAVIPFDGNGSPLLVPEATTPFRWSPDGKSLTTVRTDANGVSNLWREPLNGTAPVQLTNFDDLSILALAWSPSGDRIACLRAHVGADVTLFKNSN